MGEHCCPVWERGVAAPRRSAARRGLSVHLARHLSGRKTPDSSVAETHPHARLLLGSAAVATSDRVPRHSDPRATAWAEVAFAGGSDATLSLTVSGRSGRLFGAARLH